MDLSDINTLKGILQKHNLWAKKYFGQNFLINRDILETIVSTAKLSPEDEVVEIGPGLGTLTNELAKHSKHVTSIELDRSLLPILKENLQEYKNVDILNMDALQFVPDKDKYKVVANIPYNITSPLINLFLQTPKKPQSITLLVQKEVAEKISSIEPDMTILSLQTALFGKTTMVRKVMADCFYPSPKVDSAIIHIELYQPENPNYVSTEKGLKALSIAKRAFSQRRKKISNTIPEYKEKLEQAGVDLNRRPETLSVKEWLALVD